MTRYALIDQHSGYVWGVADAASPVEACKAVDANLGFDDREYTEHGPRASAASVHTGGYFVHEVPVGFDVDDGQDETQIAAVDAFPAVAFVEIRDFE